ncbi:MAG: DUF2309 domain-containing protein [Alphaproteobacteria bacterium]|nr:DUF2309 domain-containing protein [Alphaproteobacteria bacterium]
MLLKSTQIAPARAESFLRAAEAAGRAIPPAFPLAATVAVNPFLGQSHEDLATAAARLARVAGVKVMRRRSDYATAIEAGNILDDDLSDALLACPASAKPKDVAQLKAALGRETPEPEALPTVSHLVARATGTDWPSVIARSFGLWAGAYFDQGQALWAPASGHGAFSAWREWASHDLTPEIAGLSGFCAHVAAAPDSTERAILRATERLGITEEAAETVFHRLLMDLGGWSQHARWLLWNAELEGRTDATVTDLLAIRLIWDEALMAHAPPVGEMWAKTVAAHAEPVVPSQDQIVDAILQDATERAQQRRLSEALTGPVPTVGRPQLQAAFCIDVRSEVFRRALESLDPRIETIGFAGFFGLAVAHRAQGTDQLQPHLPVLLRPGLASSSHLGQQAETEARIAERAVRAWGRFRKAAVSSFAFVEAAGPAYGLKLVKDALGLVPKPASRGPAPWFESKLTAESKAATAAAVLKAMSFTTGHARLVLLLGHGANVVNNPHASAYHCGACGGQTGEVSARLLASLLNDPETRAGLPAHGISLPEDTRFVAGLHDTTTDRIALYDDTFAPTHEPDIARARHWLDRAGSLARAERALRLPGATEATVARRAANWSEVRPEWGLAGCAAFIAAPRSVSARADLRGRAFLHSYDWKADAGFATLELILTAPVVVASWISLQYYGSSVAPEAFGGGNKLIHNVVGGIGVLQGNGGALQPGLPWQAVDDGHGLVHEPLRLSVMIQAPAGAISEVLARHDDVRKLFDNGWLHLFVLDKGTVHARYRPGNRWCEMAELPKAA